MDYNICFISNYEKTFFYHSIAQALQKESINIFWLVVNERLYEFLTQHYPSSNILLINKSYVGKSSNKIGEFKLNELIYCDRSLRYQQGWALDYLINIQKSIYEFLKNNRIRFIFGEITYAHEILIHRITRAKSELGCKFLSPHTIRIPAGRFAFFEDEHQSQIYEIGSHGVSSPELKGNTHIKVEKPDYFDLNTARLEESRTFRARLNKIINFITNRVHDKNDPCPKGMPRRIRGKTRIIEEINKELYRFVPKSRAEGYMNKDFIYVALHKQPEASIDVIGKYYEDQLQNIINIWRVIPEDWYILVKEHPNAIGDRSILFYHRLLRYKNIVLIDENTDSVKIIRHSRVTITVSGTVAYEAALVGRRALTFVPTFFNKLDMCNRISLEDLRNLERIEVLTGIRAKDKLSRKEFKEFLFQNSFEGVIGDPISNPSSMTPDNIAKVAYAIKSIVGH